MIKKRTASPETLALAGADFVRRAEEAAANLKPWPQAARDAINEGLEVSGGDTTDEERADLCVCGYPATWMYGPDPSRVYCDACVSRGCSCTDDPNEPCCEYMEIGLP